MLILPVWSAAWAPTDKSRQLAADVFWALDATYARKEAADLLGVTEKLLSDWGQCKKPMNLFRFAELHDDFWDALLERLADRRGGIYIKARLALMFVGAALLKGSPIRSLGKVERKAVS